MTRSAGSVFYSDCPARLAIEIIASKWAVVTLHALTAGPLRHGELADRIGGISRKVLTQTLRHLQDNGLVTRERFQEAPLRVEYRLTALGATLAEPIAALTHWASTHGPAVSDFRETHAEGRQLDSGHQPS
jgi:DNA-binding HxlR family transcriptional regulator